MEITNRELLDLSTDVNKQKCIVDKPVVDTLIRNLSMVPFKHLKEEIAQEIRQSDTIERAIAVCSDFVTLQNFIMKYNNSSANDSPVANGESYHETSEF